MSAPPAEIGLENEWRTQLSLEARHRIVDKIADSLRRLLPITGREGLVELYSVSVRFEDKVYNAATSQHDYLRRISMKMLTMEMKNSGAKGPSGDPTNDNIPSQFSPDPALCICAASPALDREVVKLRNSVQNLTVKLDTMTQSNKLMKNILENQQRSLVKQSRVIKKHRKKMDLLISLLKIPQASLSSQMTRRQRRLQGRRQQAQVRRRQGLQGRG